MNSYRLPAVSAVAIACILLSSCAAEEPEAVGIDSLTVATLGDVTPAQQAFLDRFNELAEGTIDVDFEDNWEPTGQSDSAEQALAQAVADGEVDVAWVTLRSLSAIGMVGVDALQAPLLVQTQEQQREVANGEAGELMLRSLRGTEVAGLAVLPGPQQFPVAAGAPLLGVEDWAGKTVAYAPTSREGSVAAMTIQLLGGTPSANGDTPVAEIVAGSVDAAIANPAELVAGGATASGPFLTANVPLWPQMSAIVINRDTLSQLSTRQNGFIEAGVERAQDLAMTPPDVTTPVAEACAAGVLFGIASAEQLTALQSAVEQIYGKLSQDKQEGEIFAAIQAAVTNNVGSGALSIADACRWVAPAP